MRMFRKLEIGTFFCFVSSIFFCDVVMPMNSPVGMVFASHGPRFIIKLSATLFYHRCGRCTTDTVHKHSHKTESHWLNHQMLILYIKKKHESDRFQAKVLQMTMLKTSHKKERAQLTSHNVYLYSLISYCEQITQALDIRQSLRRPMQETSANFDLNLLKFFLALLRHCFCCWIVTPVIMQPKRFLDKNGARNQKYKHVRECSA